MSLKDLAAIGRVDGRKQIGKTQDMMSLNAYRLGLREYSAYTTGFYRGYGYAGSSNRRQRKRAMMMEVRS